MRKEKTKKEITGLDDERGIQQNLKKKLNIEKHETIGGLDLSDGRELKEEVIENSKNNCAATMVSTNYRRRRRRRRADQQKSAAAPTNCRRRRRGRRTALGASVHPWILL